MSLKSVLSDLSARLAGARDSIRSLKSADAELRQEHQRLTAERGKLLSAPEPAADLERHVRGAVAGLGRQFTAALGPALVTELSGRVTTDGRGRVIGTQDGSLSALLADGPTWPALCAIAPDAVTAALIAALRAHPYEPGPPLRERTGLIATVDEKLASIERQCAELVDEAAEAGVTLQHMPAEVARRLQATQRASFVRNTLALNRDSIRRGTFDHRAAGFTDDELAAAKAELGL